MLAELPQIYGVGDLGNAVSEAGSGVEFLPESAKSCAKAIMELHNLGADGRCAMGIKGREWVVANRLWSNQIHMFLSKLERL
jgi:hypothetical protein